MSACGGGRRRCRRRPSPELAGGAVPAPGPGPTTRSARSPPTGWAGRPALFVEAETRTDLLAVRRALAGQPVPVLVLGQGLEPAGGRRRLRRPGGPPGRRLCRDRAVRAAGTGGAPWCGPAAAPALPGAGPADASRPGLTGLEWAVGVPGSVGGAVRMNAGGHGVGHRRLPGAATAGSTWPHEAGGEDGPGRLAFGYRTSPLLATEVVVWAEFGLRPGDPVEAGRAAAGRDRAVAAGAPARGQQRRLGLHQPARRLGRAAGGGGRAEGPAPGDRPGSRPSTPTSSRPTTGARPTTCGG